ncbi:MAG: hypothetical protein AAGA85_03955 [Bacteroidota bacterium]
MEQEAYLNFLGTWNIAMWGLAALSVVVAIAIISGYFIRLSSLKSYKAKFDLASEREINRLLAANFSIAASIFFMANTASQSTVELSAFWFFIRIFISLCFGTLYGYVAYLIFNYYYPKRLHKKLNRLRYTPRTNAETGNKMKLLSEEEEDAYLDEGMQAEENVFSVDYDVWIDEATGDTTIEKYKGHLSALECDRCGFQTLKLAKEEIITPATSEMDGELEKEYKCTYCGRIRRKTVKIKANIDASAEGHELITDPLHQDSRISTVKVEIHDARGEVKTYEFQNLKQASSFLGEFDTAKLEQEETL